MEPKGLDSNSASNSVTHLPCDLGQPEIPLSFSPYLKKKKIVSALITSQAAARHRGRTDRDAPGPDPSTTQWERVLPFPKALRYAPSASSTVPSATGLLHHSPACPLPPAPHLTCKQAPPRAAAGNRRFKETPTTAAILASDVAPHPLTPRSPSSVVPPSTAPPSRRPPRTR